MKMYSVNIVFILLHVLFVFCNAEGKTYEALDANNKLIKDVSAWGIIKQMLIAEWEQNRLPFIASGIAEQIENMNSTVVASQHIYDDNGNLKQIKTLELNFPKLANAVKGPQNILEDDSSEDDGNVDHYMKKLSSALDTFDTLTLTGMPMHMAFEKYDEDENGQVNSYVFLSHNFIGAYYEGLGFINETVEINDRKLLEDYIKKNSKKENDIPLVILSHDVDGNLIKDKSILMSTDGDLADELIVITDMQIEDYRMLVAATRAFTKSVFEKPETLKEDFVAAMKKEFPNYFWFVITSDDYNFELDDHVFIKMKKDPIRLMDEEEPVTLVGVKINDTS